MTARFYSWIQLQEIIIYRVVMARGDGDTDKMARARQTVGLHESMLDAVSLTAMW